MASSYTGLGTELMTTGENAGTWGTTTNTNLQIIEQISGGYTEQDIAGSADTTTLSVSDGSTGAVLSHRIIKFTGTITGNQIVTIPLDVQQMYIVVNGTSGAYTVQFKYVSGSGSSVTFAATDKGTKLLYAAADHASNPNLVDSGIGSTAGHDLDGNELILDADADTSITADTDDQIDIKISGADDFQFTANTFTAQAGSTIAAQAFTATTVTASGIVKTDDTTEATSTTDGSLQTDGGLSVAKDAVLGDDLKLLSDSAVLSFGADSDTTLTHTDGTGLTLNSANKLLFRDSALSISSSTDGQLDIDADTEVEIATTTLDLNGALDVSGASQLSGAVTVGVDGTGLDVKFFGDTSGSFLLWDQSDDALELTDSSPIKIGDSGDMEVYHDGTNSYITNSQGALKVATETSGIAVTIGHTTSEVTVADNLTVTGTLTLGSGAELTEAELEFLDGITAGTAAASKAMVLDSSADITGGRNLTISGELDAATGDFSGDVDVDGTLEADAITINGTAIGSVYGVIAGSSSIVTTGALDSGSITSGFGAIDNGTSNIRSATITAETAFVPDASGGADLGTTALEFNDLFLNDSGSIQFGDDQDTTITHTDGTGLTLNSTNKFCFRDSALSISSSTDGQLDIDADTEVEIATTTLDLNGALDVSGAVTIGGVTSFPDGSNSAPSITNTGDTNCGLYFSAADTLAFTAAGTAQFTMADGAIAPVTDDDVDLGTSGLEFKDGYFDGTLYCDTLNLAGTSHTSIEDPTALAIALG